MKTCILITGTNAVGKSSLAWGIIDRYGGIDRIQRDVTYCRHGAVCLAGTYGRTRYCGVDRLVNANGSSCTSRLSEVVDEGLRHADTVFCEGSYLNTFGLNLANALFRADRQLVVSLWADPQTLYRRILGRSNGRHGDGVRAWDRIMGKQRQAMVAARKWQSIGCPVLQFKTDETTVENELDTIINKINEICTR